MYFFRTCLFAFVTSSLVLLAPPLLAQQPSADSQPEGLTEQFLYQYLISEIAGQRGRGGVAIQGMTGLAKATRDPRLARRALEIAFQTRLFSTAMDAASLWLELEPDSVIARQAMAMLVNNYGTFEASVERLKPLLGDKEKAPALYMQLNAVLSRFPDKASVLKSVQELAALNPQMPEALFAVAQAALVAKNIKLAQDAAQQASALNSKFEPAIILQGQMLREKAEEDAAGFYRDYLLRNPDAKDVRVSYARLLVTQKSYLSAREQFRIAEENAPDDPELPYAIGLISQQIEDHAAAEAAFQRTLELKPRDANPILISLGQIEEARTNWEAAIGWYQRVTDGDYFVTAQLKIAGVLTKQSGIASGRKHLQELEATSPEQHIQLILAEAQLLRDARAFGEAYSLLSETLAKYPDTVELIYDRAMIAEKLDRVDELERDLRRVIELKPDHAHAYNALGYTLADRTKRYDEAYDLIQKALALAPADPFILDSLGWVQYRLGKTGESLLTLKKAYAFRPDPEIAAHLGEVLWTSGSHDEAAKLWRAALLEFPGNDSLRAILNKYKP